MSSHLSLSLAPCASKHEANTTKFLVAARARTQKLHVAFAYRTFASLSICSNYYCHAFSTYILASSWLCELASSCPASPEDFNFYYFPLFQMCLNVCALYTRCAWQTCCRIKVYHLLWELHDAARRMYSLLEADKRWILKYDNDGCILPSTITSADTWTASHSNDEQTKWCHWLGPRKTKRTRCNENETIPGD